MVLTLHISDIFVLHAQKGENASISESQVFLSNFIFGVKQIVFASEGIGRISLESTLGMELYSIESATWSLSPWTVLCGIIFLCSIIIYRYPHLTLGDSEITTQVIAMLAMACSALFTTLTILASAGPHYALREAYRAGRCKTVRGAIDSYERYTIRNSAKQFAASFSVEGIKFVLSDVVSSPGYNNPSGPLRSGMRVQISYCHHDIVRIYLEN